MSESKELTFKRIFVFWYPLAATWLMMAAENPFVAAIIARLAEPKFNLAAFGVAFSFALIIEAPIIMLMAASTALVKDADSLTKMRRFAFTLNGIITLLMILLLLPPLFFPLAIKLIGLPESVTILTHRSLLLLLPWPAAIGFRRLYQGILIRHNQTRRVAYGTIVRLFTMSAIGLILFKLDIQGAYVGALALSGGVVMEAVASRIMANKTLLYLSQHTEAPGPDITPLTYRFIARFYYPLALMSMLSLGIHPLITFFMGKSRFPIESLAVLPVVNALVFIFRSMGLSFHEVGVALMGKKNENYIPIRNFAFMLGSIVVLGLSVIAFTPLARVWFSQISGLTPALSRFAYLPTGIMVLLPGLSVWISLQRALLVNTKQTQGISRATLIEVGTIALVLFIGITFFDMIGAVAAAAAYTLGRMGANIYLAAHQHRKLKDRIPSA